MAGVDFENEQKQKRNEVEKMSDLIAFLQSREADKVVEFAACKDWKDEKGNPVLWKLKKLHTKELERLRAKHFRLNAKKKDVEIDNYAFNNEAMAASVVFPNLKDAKLADMLLPDTPLDQRTPGNVLYAILSDDSEYQALLAEFTELQGWGDGEDNESQVLVEAAKNE